MTERTVRAQTLLDYFAFAVESGKPDLLLSKVGGSWTPVTAEQFGRKTRSLAMGLAELGVDQGDRVAILSENRPEWPMTDFATLGLGAITVPVYSTYFAPQVEYILKDVRARVIVVSNAHELQKVLEVRSRCPELEHILLMDGPPPEGPGVRSFESVVRWGEGVLEAMPDAWAERLPSISSDTHATIIYTSGTTGEPKGAVLSHGNFISNVTEAAGFFHLGRETVALSFLPLAHVFQRMIDYACFSKAVTIAYVESLEKLGEGFLEARPHCFAAVPRVYEKVLEKIQQSMEKASGAKKAIFDWAVGVGRQRVLLLERDKPVPGILGLKYALADRLVFRKIRERLGGRFQYSIAAGAALGRPLAEFFWGAGIQIYEGYGLTETSPTLSCNRPGAWRLGTVGRAVPGVSIRIAEDGEVLAKGPNVMKGYWGKPEETRRTIDEEGWFHTGDVGQIDADGYLTLTDRKKEIIVSGYGANIAPGPIEGALKQMRYVASAVLIGNDRKFLSALIVPAFERLEAWATVNGVPFRSPEDLIRNPKVRNLFQQTIDIINGDEPAEKRIRAFALLANDFTIEGNELTPTLKLRRQVITKKYAELIDTMYRAAEVTDSVLSSR